MPKDMFETRHGGLGMGAGREMGDGSQTVLGGKVSTRGEPICDCE